MLRAAPCVDQVDNASAGDFLQAACPSKADYPRVMVLHRVARIAGVVVVLASAALSAPACSSDDSSGAGSGGSSAGGGGDAAAGAAGAAGTEAGAGLCDNPTDSVAVDATYPVPGADGDTTMLAYNRIARQCGLDCITEPTDEAQSACAVQCLQDATNNAVSAGCTSCVVAAVLCGRDNCLNDCLPPDNWDGCVACLCGQNILGVNCMKTKYEPCAGIPSTTCGD